VHCSYLGGSIEINVLPGNPDSPGQEFPKAFIVYPKDNNDVIFARFLTLGREFMGSRLNVQLSWYTNDTHHRQSLNHINGKIRANMDRPQRQRVDTRDEDGFQKPGKHFNETRSRGGHNNNNRGGFNNNNRGGFNNNNNRGGFNNNNNRGGDYNNNPSSQVDRTDRWRRDDSSSSSSSTDYSQSAFASSNTKSLASSKSPSQSSQAPTAPKQQWRAKTNTTTAKPVVGTANRFAMPDDEEEEEDEQ
jgi:hypothetical protein